MTTNPTPPNQEPAPADAIGTEVDFTQANPLLDLLLRMEQRIETLERQVSKNKPNHRIPADIRREGAEYAARKRVYRVTETTNEEETERSASVLCGFGFVHHPWVRFTSRDAQVRITGFRCDCQTFSEGSFCSHCAALVADIPSDTAVTIESGSAVTGSSDLENRQAGIKSIRLVSDTISASGDPVFRGKALCSFNFVHYPELVFDTSGAVRSFDCTCSQPEDRMCSHCAALLPLAKERLPEILGERLCADSEPDEADLPDFTFSETAAAEFAAAEALSEEIPAVEAPVEEPIADEIMTIRFGTEVETGEPVLWYPNDTNQITHINMGIIGTMGTGKTQFTKSVITQLYRQRRSNPGAEEPGILIFDYKGDYNEEKTDFIEASGARVLKLHRLPFNPFALSDFKVKPQLHVHTAMSFADTLTRIDGLGPIQKTTLVQSILAAYESCGITGDPASWSRPAPTFAQVHAQYSKGRSQRGDSLTAAMDTIAMFELFATDPLQTVSLYEMLRGTVVLDMSGYPSDLKNLAVAIILDLFYAQMLNSSHSRLVTTEDGSVYRQIKKVILVDEADNIMSSGLPVLKNIIKEGREFGVGMVLSTQFLDHFRGADEDYRKYMKTWVVHNVENLKRSDVEYVFQLPASDARTEQAYQHIKQLEKHHSLVRIGTGSPVYIRDLPFYQIADDVQESYLPKKPDDPDDPDTPDAAAQVEVPGSGEAEASIEFGEPAEFDFPAEPEEPAEFDFPADPEEPAEFDFPTEPEEPAEFDFPTEPEEPAEFDFPADPEEPDEFEKPGKPAPFECSF